MLDILIRGGLIVDGTGNTPYPGDLAISSGRVAGAGRLEGAEAATVIDASGLAVAPGFIDVHSHSDLSLPSHPRATSSLAQGITTEVAGSCGWSLAPVKAETARSVLKELTEGLTGSVPPGLAVQDEKDPHPRRAADEPGQGKNGLAWYSFGDYLTWLENRGLGVNLYPVVGQSLIRAHVVGTDQRRAGPGELAAMKALLEACLEEGARGMSTGRGYSPGRHAPTEEIIELCRVVAGRGGIYTTHIKDESGGLVESVEEAIRIGRESGVKVEVSHHKAVGRSNFGKVRETLAMMEEARRSGVDITCDAYPYAFAQVFSLLGEVPGVRPDQTPEEIEKLLVDHAFREKVTGELVKAAEREGGSLPGVFSRPEHIMMVSVGRDHSLEGQDLGTVFGEVLSGARQPGTAGPDAGGDPAHKRPAAPDPALIRRIVDVGLDLLLAQDLHVNLAAIMSEEDVETVLAHPETLVGTDAFALDRNLGSRTPIHPRHYGTFPRIVGYYRRERRLADLATMVRKVTGLPSRKLGLSDRGTLARGNWADVVVFDPDTLADRATAKEPYLEPTGVKWVVVNGRVALENGKASGTMAGMVLRR
ncbi:MAG: D-aminoacylase [Bacillota bacterium]|nr:MAG: D-aminoacylase [Bacillota bacterium]